MADQPRQVAKDSGQETIFNSGIGDDWGEAFEAEDFMAAPSEETISEFFLPDEATCATIISVPTEDVEQVVSLVVSPPGLLAKLCRTLLARLRRIPLSLRLVAVIIPLLALAVFLIMRGKAQEQIAPSPDVQSEIAVAPQSEVETPTSHPSESELVPKTQEVSPVPSSEHLAIPEPQHPSSSEGTPKLASEQGVSESVPLEGKELRKKWRFPAIIVHAKTNKDQGSLILSIDLTLILKLAPEVMPPYDKESFIREILYQFYANQPVDDLQRYALERGEVNRKLQAWIVKQWPELHLDSIVIDRYQLL